MSSRANFLTVSLCLVVGCAAVAQSEMPTEDKWAIGDPIVTYWAGPATHNVLDDTAVAQLVAGGWNMGWADTVEQLDIFHHHGMRAMLSLVDFQRIDLNDQAQVRRLEEKIAKAKDHPALYAYYGTDEPGAAAFAKVGKFVAWLRQRDPAHPAWINLYPMYASAGRDGQLGTEGDTVTAYREHLRLYMETVKPSMLSYDHYNFFTDGDQSLYFPNLAMIRQAALDGGVPFVNVIQAVDWQPGWRSPTEGEMRWLTYTTLAYGGQGICHFVYNFKNVKSGFFDQKDNDRPLPRYWSCSRINRDFVAIGTELQPLTSLGAYHLGTVPTGGEALPADSPFRVEPTLAPVAFDPPKPVEGLLLTKPVEGLLLGYFGSTGKPTHVLVVNLDYTNAVETDLVGPGPMQVFHAPTRAWQPAGDGTQVKLKLPPGGGTLVSLQQ